MVNADLLALLKDLRTSARIDPGYWAPDDGGVQEILERLGASIAELEAAPELKCGTCKNWEANKEELTGRCDSEKFVDANSPNASCPPDGLMYWDYESYSCGFETGPDFACIHWQPREPK